MNKKRLYQPLMRRLPDHGHDNYFIVDGYSQELLLKIRDLLDVLAPIGDDHRHGLWKRSRQVTLKARGLS